MHVCLDLIREKERGKCIFVQHCLRSPSNIWSAIYLFNYLSNESARCVCVLISASICKQCRASPFSISPRVDYGKTHRRRWRCTKIRDQVLACVCLLRFFACDTHVVQLPKGNPSTEASLSLDQSICYTLLFSQRSLEWRLWYSSKRKKINAW